MRRNPYNQAEKEMFPDAAFTRVFKRHSPSVPVYDVFGRKTLM
jgi:hypothetical protein